MSPAKTTKNNKLYKGKYTIGIYDLKDETCIAIFDNAQELADYLETSLHTAYAMLYDNVKGKRKNIVVKNKLYELSVFKC